MHKQKASNLFQLVNCNDDENDIQVDQIAGIIKKEIMKLPKLKEEYPQLDEVSMWQSCSETLLLLLSKVSPSLNKTLCAGLIGNIITTVITSYHFMLQIALELYARKKKNQQLYAFGASASYNELRGTRFWQPLPQIF